MVQKNSELSDGDPRNKYKYRVVFGGNIVVGNYWEAAVFQDMGSSPSTMTAGKLLDYYSCINGHLGEQADACQAYMQSDFTGTPTWIMLP